MTLPDSLEPLGSELRSRAEEAAAIYARRAAERMGKAGNARYRDRIARNLIEEGNVQGLIAERPSLRPEQIVDLLEGGVEPNSPLPEGSGAQPAAFRSHELVARRADTIKESKIAWLWRGWLPVGKLALLGGRPGEGKSTIALDLVARLTTGSAMPDGYKPRRAVRCAILSAEDDAADTLLPRLRAADADLRQVVVLDGVRDLDTGLGRPWTLPDDVPALRHKLLEDSIGLVVIDPLSAYLHRTVDSHRDSDVRGALHPLTKMASELPCSVLATRHHRKAAVDDVRDAGLGSVAFTAATRVEWVVGRDPQSGDQILAVSKTNVGPKPPSLSYRMEQQQHSARVGWRSAENITADGLMAPLLSEADRRERRELAALLREIVGDGEQPVAQVLKRVHDAGFPGSDRTIRRAYQAAGLVAQRKGFGPNASYVLMRAEDCPA